VAVRVVPVERGETTRRATAAENLPTKCYTNGEPPASISMAEKFKLPSSRWINTNSIKAHITAKKTGVNVGMTFFYQAWNHRKVAAAGQRRLLAQGLRPRTRTPTTRRSRSRCARVTRSTSSAGTTTSKSRCAMAKASRSSTRRATRVRRRLLAVQELVGHLGLRHRAPDGSGLRLALVQVRSGVRLAVTAETPMLGGGGGGGGGTGTPRSYTSSAAAAIPTTRPPASRARSTWPTPAPVSGDVKITVDISHTYAGDLKVSLVKGTTEKVLSATSGGSATDIKEDVHGHGPRQHGPRRSVDAQDRRQRGARIAARSTAGRSSCVALTLVARPLPRRHLPTGTRPGAGLFFRRLFARGDVAGLSRSPPSSCWPSLPPLDSTFFAMAFSAATPFS